jgi:hypothetical protein
LRSIAAFIIENILGDPKFAQLLRNARAKPFDEYMRLCEARDKMNEEFYAEVWDKYGFDGIIAPVQVTPAIPNGYVNLICPRSVSDEATSVLRPKCPPWPLRHSIITSLIVLLAVFR